MPMIVCAEEEKNLLRQSELFECHLHSIECLNFSFSEIEKTYFSMKATRDFPQGFRSIIIVCGHCNCNEYRK